MNPNPAPKLRTRKPSATVPWPRVLWDADEKGSPALGAAAFTGSSRVGTAYWLELGEDTADEYGAVDGADYAIIQHNGTFRDILEQLEAVHAEAKRTAAAGEKPVVLIIDSVSQLWRMLVHWTHQRARRSNAGQHKLRFDPDAELRPAMNLWDDTTERWERVMHLVRTMPAIVILIARNKEIPTINEAGKPVDGTKTWQVEGHKSLIFDATLWVRTLRGDDHLYVVSARSLTFQVPREGKPKDLKGVTLDTLIFDLMQFEPHNDLPQTPPLAGDLAQSWIRKVEEIANRDGLDGLTAVWQEAVADKDLTRDEVGVVRVAIERAAAELRNPPQLHDPTSDAARLRAAAEQARAEADPFHGDPDW
ncbi:DEAD/DEAH box helicase family protein [Streptomyces sp. L500]